MGKKMARLMTRIIALEEAMALMLRGSLNHGLKKKKAKSSKPKKITAKKAKATRQKKIASKEAPPKMAFVKKPVGAITTTSVKQTGEKPVAAAKSSPVPGPQTAMPPRPAPVAVTR